MYKTDDDILARATVETWVIKAEKGARDCCPKCDGRVFEAEKMVTASVSKNISVCNFDSTRNSPSFLHETLKYSSYNPKRPIFFKK